MKKTCIWLFLYVKCKIAQREELKYYLTLSEDFKIALLKPWWLCYTSDIFVFNSTFKTNLVSSVTYLFCWLVLLELFDIKLVFID